MQTYIQPALFDDTEIIGIGRPQPWPAAIIDIPDTITPVTQDELPFDEEPQP